MIQIADFEPQHSIVVTPQKMLKFYNDVKVANELYPWQSKLVSVAIMLKLLTKDQRYSTAL